MSARPHNEGDDLGEWIRVGVVAKSHGIRGGIIGAEQQRRNACGVAFSNQRLTCTVANSSINMVQERLYLAVITLDQRSNSILSRLSRLVLERSDRAVQRRVIQRCRRLQEKNQ